MCQCVALRLFFWVSLVSAARQSPFWMTSAGGARPLDRGGPTVVWFLEGQ
jgi:hypothetical protein